MVRRVSLAMRLHMEAEIVLHLLEKALREHMFAENRFQARGRPGPTVSAIRLQASGIHAVFGLRLSEPLVEKLVNKTTT
jgi:hypothetical protein